ncbi:MAG: PaaI family thioesterase, partial [Thermoanaerobaculia bacterium]
FAGRPLHRAFGMRIIDLTLDRCTVEAELNEYTDNGSGTIHGGVIAVLADTAVAGALATNFDGKMGFATSHLGVHYIRRAKGPVRATATIVKKGSNVCVARIDVHDGEGALVAFASSDYVLTTSRSE